MQVHTQALKDQTQNAQICTPRALSMVCAFNASPAVRLKIMLPIMKSSTTHCRLISFGEQFSDGGSNR